MARKVDVKNLQVENPAVAKTRPPAERDSVDETLEVWARELPQLDLETEGIVTRIDQLHRYLEKSMRETLDAFDLSHGEYKLMVHLRYWGPPYRGRPGKLADRLGLSSGAMTNRLDNLERRGLVRRIDDPDDRRGVLVELTDEGKRLWDEAVGVQAEKEAIVDAALTADEKLALNDLLRRLMSVFQASHGPLYRKDEAA
jgi:DNA-binding MarR family transcriptional regulator